MRRSAVPKIALLALIWGSSFLWIKLAIRGLSPVEVTLARLVLGAVLLFPIALLRHDAIPRQALVWGHVVIAALFANAAPYLLFALGEQHVASSTAGMLNATTPLWTVAIALAIRHQKATTLRQAGGLIVGFAGAVVIFQPWQAAGGFASIGGIESIAAAACYGISYVYMDKFLARRGVSPIALSACQLLAAAVWLAVALGFAGAPAPQFSVTTVASIAVLGFLGTGVAYVLNYQIITSEGATIASTVTYLLPVVAIVLGVLVLNEHITVIVLAGIALILIGVALTRQPTHTDTTDRAANAETHSVPGASTSRRWFRMVDMRLRRGRAPDSAPDKTTPAREGWLAEGAEVVHARFGTGTIARIGDYQGVPTIWINFDTGTRRALEIKSVERNLRPRRIEDATTPANPEERCDYCGGRPVITTITGHARTRRCCISHRAELARDLRH